MSERQVELSSLKNIGTTMAQWLRDVGIHTPEELRAIGSVAAWRRVRSAYGNRVTIIGLYALEGAIADVHWNALPEEIKSRLIQEAQM
ncbi:MAG: TfoX/Sxy family protein [Chloroflexota bacterium]